MTKHQARVSDEKPETAAKMLFVSHPSRWSDPETVIALMLLLFVIVAAFKLLIV